MLRAISEMVKIHVRGQLETERLRLNKMIDSGNLDAITAAKRTLAQIDEIEANLSEATTDKHVFDAVSSLKSEFLDYYKKAMRELGG